MKNTVIITLSLLVLGLSGYLFYDASSENMSETEVKMELNELKNDYKFIRKDLESTIAKMQDRNELILAQKDKIEYLLSKNNITEEELRIAKNLMQSISMSVLEEFQNQVADLETQKKKLTEESLVSEEKIITLSAKIQNLETTQSSLNEKYSVINQKYNVEKKESDKKTVLLSYASGLSLSNFIMKGVKVKSSGKEVETDRASRVNRLKVSFDINGNPLAESGNKELYIVVKNPDGISEKFENKPTGTLVANGKMHNYSDKISVNYDKTEGTPIEFEWDGTEFKKGDYVIEIYQNTEANKFVKIGGTTKKLD